MSEMAKTLTYGGVALVTLIIAGFSRPKPPVSTAPTQVGKPLNPVDDPLSATSLEIIKYDEDTASIRTFAVAQKGGLWTIPSHQGYPADAERQMAEAATCVMNLEILGVASTHAGDHSTYGVIEPDQEKLKAGTVGVGTRVTMKKAKNESLVHMVIGKEVKDEPSQRYVRELGRDPVYVVKLDPSKLSTKFDDWIEDDLLKLNTWDVRAVMLKDYSVDLQFGLDGLRVVMDPRSEISLKYDDSNSKWVIELLKDFDRESERFVEVELAEDEEVNSDELNDLKNALDDLKIVDVERKPEGLSRDLKAEKEFANNREAVNNLFQRGFFPSKVSEDGYNIFSSEGEVLCQMKDGVEYILRFGKIVLGAEEDSKTGEDDEDGENSGKRTGINRYIFVMAHLNEDVIDKPELEELPEMPETGEAGGEESAQEQGGQSDSQPQQAADASTGDANEEPAEETQDGKDSQEGDSEQDASAEDESGEDDIGLDEVIAKRKEIEKENQRKLDVYQEKVTKARDKVKELNDRFGDWYYVISDDVYKKIHLGRKDIIKKKEKDEENEGQEGGESTDNGEDSGALSELEGLEDGLPDSDAEEK